MKHFLITRFNLKVEQWKTAKDGSVVLTDKWLEDRFELFKRYCLPSVINQKNQDFNWLVFFDIDTPPAYKDLAGQINRDYSNFNPLFIDGNQSLLPSLKDYISEQLDETDEFILTTRLDNDDAIHRDFIGTIQRMAIKKDKTIIDLKLGYQMDVSGVFCEYRRFSSSFNPFVSLVESKNDFYTVISRMHRDWSDTTSVVVYDRHPLWIEVIHKKNKLNVARSNVAMIRKINLLEFGIINTERERNSLFIVRNNFFVLAKKIKNFFLGIK